MDKSEVLAQVRRAMGPRAARVVDVMWSDGGEDITLVLQRTDGEIRYCDNFTWEAVVDMHRRPSWDDLWALVDEPD